MQKKNRAAPEFGARCVIAITDYFLLGKAFRWLVRG